MEDVREVKNKKFQKREGNIHVNSTQSLLQLDRQIAALPKSFGMTADLANKTFPPYEYPKCHEIRPDPQGTVRINRKEKEPLSLDFTCNNNEIPKVYTGPLKNVTLATSREKDNKNWPKMT